jgi:hypothetical protein
MNPKFMIFIQNNKVEQLSLEVIITFD